MAIFKIGQRWISETEPELGLGIVQAVSRHQLEVAFPASAERRLYAPANAPIKRVAFHVGDTIQSQQGQTAEVTEIREDDGLITYLCGAQEIPKENSPTRSVSASRRTA